MALRKSIPTQFGDSILATYWNIGEIHDIIKDSQLRVVFYGYADKASRDVNKDPMKNAVLSVQGPQYTAGMNRAEIYAAAKLLPEFSGAEDI